MKIHDTIVLHPVDDKYEVLPHFDSANRLHLVSLEKQWDKAFEVINEWIDANPRLRMTFLSKQVGAILSTLYKIHLEMPRPAYNIVKHRGVTIYDGEPAAMYKLYMPNKGMFQDNHIDPSWYGLLSLTAEPHDCGIFVDMLDHIWCLRDREEIPIDVTFRKDCYYGSVYDGGYANNEENVWCGKGDRLTPEQFLKLRPYGKPSHAEQEEFCWAIGRTPDSERIDHWRMLYERVINEDRGSETVLCLNIWYGKGKFNELKELAKKVRFVVS